MRACLRITTPAAAESAIHMIELIVPGVPVQQGSVSAFVNRKTGRAQVAHQSPGPLSRYRGDIREAAERADVKIADGPIDITIAFFFPRPKSHFGTGRNASVVKDSAPSYPIGRPDLDKLVRAVLDALTGFAFKDDSQVVEIVASKDYCDYDFGPQTRIQLAQLPGRESVPEEREVAHG